MTAEIKRRAEELSREADAIDQDTDMKMLFADCDLIESLRERATVLRLEAIALTGFCAIISPTGPRKVVMTQGQ